MREERKRNQPLQWHPAFYAGIQIDLSEETDRLSFENEHLLGTKPKAIDVLIIKKRPKEKIRKNIGKIFRTHKQGISIRYRSSVHPDFHQRPICG